MNRRERAQFAIKALRSVIPAPATELEYVNEYELIVAVILSAQCTDERVNRVTPELFSAFPDVRSMSEADPSEIYPFIRSVSYPNNKSKHLTGMARMVVDEFNGRVPSTVPELMRLPGVGRKTAQVVAAVAFDADALPVDTHVFRVANRIGLTRNAPTPLKVEQQLKRVLPVEDWSEGHHLLILHGRYCCTARSPSCSDCPVRPACLYYERLQRLPQAIAGLTPRRGRFYCKTRNHYFDLPSIATDRYGTEQAACPRCGSMNVFDSRTGNTMKRVPDFRV